MANLSSPDKGDGRQQELTAVLSRIQVQTENDSPDGVVFIKDPSALAGMNLGPRTETVRKVANSVYDDLLCTLGSIAEDAFDGAVKKGDPNSDKYAYVLESLEPIAIICRALAEGDRGLPLVRDSELEGKHAREYADELIAYKSPAPFSLNGVRIKSVGVEIRSKRWQRPRDVIRREESAQPKFAITIVTDKFPDEEIRVRVDKEAVHGDSERDSKISFDVVGPRDILAQLDFPNSDNRHTHHFNSIIDIESQGVTFPEMLGAYNAVIANRIVKRGTSIGRR